MTDEQLQRIHDIEYSCDSREELAERIVALEDEAKRLQTCVLTLDSELADWKGQYDPTDIYVRKAQEENEKLRELVTFYLGCLTKGHVNCDSCAFSGEDNCDHGRKVIESAQQVGIEVDG